MKPPVAHTLSSASRMPCCCWPWAALGDPALPQLDGSLAEMHPNVPKHAIRNAAVEYLSMTFIFNERVCWESLSAGIFHAEETQWGQEHRWNKAVPTSEQALVGHRFLCSVTSSGTVTLSLPVPLLQGALGCSGTWSPALKGVRK